LRKLRRKLSNFTRNNTGELAKQIHLIALDYNAKIVMENLEKFPLDMSKDSNRKVSLIPFALLRERVITRSIDTGVPLGYVDPYHTSKWCPRCGSVNPPHSKPYALYRCSSCGLIVNSDRKASFVVALKKLVERKRHANPNYMLQTSTGGVPVNALFRRNEGCEVNPCSA
jgi:IS605 OrfB family transposase